MALNQHIQFYRNQDPLSSRTEALAVFSSNTAVTGVDEATPVVVRYNEGGHAHTILGIKNNLNGEPAFTVFEGKDVTEADRNNQLDALISKISADTAVNGQYVSEVKYADGAITISRVDLPVSGVSDSAQADEFVTEITLDNKNHLIKANRAKATTSGVTRTADADASGLTATTAEDALQELNTKVENNATAGKVTLTSVDPTDDNYVSAYTIKQGNTEVGTINIPKDQFLSGVNFIESATSAVATGIAIGDPYLEFVWNISADGKTNTHATSYVNVKKLVDIYKGTSGSGIAITVDGYDIKAQIEDKAVTTVKLADNIQDELNKAVTAVTVNNVIATVTTGNSGASANVTVNGKDIKVSDAYTAATGNSKVATGDTIDTAIGKLEGQIDASTKRNTISSPSKSITVSTTAEGTTVDVNHNNTLGANTDGSLFVHIDNATLSTTADGTIYVLKVDGGTY